MNTRLVVIGGVAAGMSAAARAKRHNPSLEVTVFERTGYVSYSACGLPFYISGLVPDVAGLIARTPEHFAADGIQVYLKHEAIAIDTGARTVAVRDLASGALRDVPYDRLILATGAQATRPDVPGSHAAGIFTLRTVEDADAIKAWLAMHRPRKAVIVGAGYIGIELAESICAHGVAVTVVEVQNQVMPALDPDLAARVQQRVEDMGIRVLLGAQVISFVGVGLVGDVVARVLAQVGGVTVREGSDTFPVPGEALRVREVVTTQGSLPADIVILGGGARPAVELARTAGIALGATGAVAVDAEQRTNLADIWAAGAVGETHHRLLNKPIYFPLARAATLQGRVAGLNAASTSSAGRSARFRGTLGTAVVKAFGLTVALTGLTELQAKTAGFDAASVTVTSTSRASFMPGSERIQTRLVFENGSGRVLGAQMVGGDEVAKRLDVVAAALQAGWTAEDLAEADLTYTPPVAPLWDGSLAAATLAARQIRR